MVDINYIRRYFDEYASKWSPRAYGGGTATASYPVGAHRMRLAIEQITNHIGSTDCKMIDLGCGGGELCIHAALLGMNATGIDISEGMISEAKKRRDSVPEEVQSRLTFIVADALQKQFPPQNYDAVAALGLIEYLPDDEDFFKEAYRLLRAGGILVVSCRNRLFNLFSLNDYTTREIEDGFGEDLLFELRPLLEKAVPKELMMKFVQNLELIVPDLKEAIEFDMKTEEKNEKRGKDVRKFEEARRQHTPTGLWSSAKKEGFANPVFVGVHPHPLPPRVEDSCPRFYNQFARAFEIFESLPVSLVWSSAFIAVFTKY